MKNEYYNSEDLKKFTNITDWDKELGDKFFNYYVNVCSRKIVFEREVFNCISCIPCCTLSLLYRCIYKRWT